MTALKAEIRELVGNDARKLRRDGTIPAVIYAKDFGNLNIQINKNEFIRAYKGAHESKEMEIEVGSDKFACKIVDIDVDPVYVEPRHVDFLLVGKSSKKAEEIKK